MGKPNTFTLFIIEHESDFDWGKKYWDTYGFDYDNERKNLHYTYAWALDSDDELRDALNNAGINYTTALRDADKYFGV